MNGSQDFIDMLHKYLDIGDRRIITRNLHTLGGKRYDSVYINFYNLPEGLGGAGGGAEGENNRMSFWVEGFDKDDPHAPPPTGKVKVKLSNSALPRSYNLRAKTAEPEKIAKYVAEFLNKVVREVPPKFTHTVK